MSAMLDGCCVGIPGMLLVPNAAEGDMEYHQTEGESWWPYPPHIKNDVGGDLRYFANRVKRIKEKNNG